MASCDDPSGFRNWKNEAKTSDVQFTILQMPEHIIQNSLAYLSYHEISEARRVCQYFNRCCQELLTQGFNKVDKFHNLIQREVKSKLPRRESERRNHELSRHVDILSAVETRLSLLSMTYSKYIDHGLCCFIPGKVLDELFHLLHKLQVPKSQPPRAHEFLQELRDISSMAMEHFEEHIIPGLKQHLPSGSVPFALPDPFTAEQGSSSPVIHISSPTMSRMPVLRQELHRLQHQVRTQTGTLMAFKRELAEHKNKMAEQLKINTEQEKKLQEQSRKLQEQSGLIAEQNSRIDRLQIAINNMNNTLSSVSSSASEPRNKHFDTNKQQVPEQQQQQDTEKREVILDTSSERRRPIKQERTDREMNRSSRTKRRYHSDVVDEAKGKALKRKKY